MSSTPMTQTTRTTMARTKKAWPSGLQIPSPTHFDWTLMGAPLLVESCGKTALSKKRAAAMVMRARPRPRSRSEATARTTATTAGRHRSHQTADQQAEAEVVGQLGGGEGADTGQCGLAERELSPMPVIRVMDRKISEKARPALKTFSHVFGIQVSMETMKAASRTYQSDADDAVQLRGPQGGRGGRGGGVDGGQRILGVAELAQPGHDEQGGDQHDERQGGENGRRPHAARRKIALEDGVGDAHDDPHQGGDGHRPQ